MNFIRFGVAHGVKKKKAKRRNNSPFTCASSSFLFARRSLEARLEPRGRPLTLPRHVRRRRERASHPCALKTSTAAAVLQVGGLGRAAQLEEAPGRGGVEGLLLLFLFF